MVICFFMFLVLKKYLWPGGLSCLCAGLSHAYCGATQCLVTNTYSGYYGWKSVGVSVVASAISLPYLYWMSIFVSIFTK